MPLTGDSIWADFLAKLGSGLHHVRFNVPEMEPVIEHCKEHDIGVVQKASSIRPGTSWANFDTERLVGFAIEVMRPVPGTSGRTPALVDGRVEG